MEPVSPLSAAAAILGLAGKAWDLGRYIHNVYQGAKTVDTRIKNLNSEVHGLASTCDLVHAGLACVLTESASEKHSGPYDPDGSLKKGICGQVARCESTIEELGKIAERLWPRKKKFVDRTVRELRLQDAKEQIDDIRARIKSHTDALHTVLLVLSIKIAHISPARALDQLPEDLADLRESILRIEARLEHAPAPGYTAGGETPDLVECARGTLRSGTTLLNESLAGSTVDVDSVIGGEQAAVIDKAVEEWMASAERTGHEHRIALPTPPKHSADVDAYESDSLESSDGKTGCDDDDEQVEFAKAARKAGRRAYDKKDWQSAKNLFATSKKTFARLPVNRKDLNTLSTLQYKISACSFYLGFIDDAESELQEILHLEPDSDKQRILHCDTHHSLAIIYVCKNNLDAAKDICKRSLNARSRLLGMQHQARLKSIALLSRICELLGETADSEVYLSMIPDDQRSKLVATMSKIRPSDVDEPASSAPNVERARANRSVRRMATEKPTVVSKGRRSGARRS
jgi:tetratricopeptide (TPR) repeat protein